MDTAFWKGKEIKFLRENYENMTYSEIANALDRSTKAVAHKAEELGYQRTLSKKKDLTDESGNKNQQE